MIVVCVTKKVYFLEFLEWSQVAFQTFLGTLTHIAKYVAQDTQTIIFTGLKEVKNFSVTPADLRDFSTQNTAVGTRGNLYTINLTQRLYRKNSISRLFVR